MKKCISLLLCLASALPLFSCSSINGGERNLKPANVALNGEDSVYSLSIKDNPYGTLQLSAYEAKAGWPIAINYFPADNYVLDHFEVNGNSIGLSNSFAMPKQDTCVEGIFKKAIEDTPYVVSTKAVNATSKGHWYFNFTDESLVIKTKVIDQCLVNNEGIKMDDYCEVIIQPKGNSQWVKNKTVSFGINSFGECFYRTAVSGTMMSDPQYVEQTDGITYSSSQTYTNKREGFTGYITTMEIPYSVFESNKNTFKSQYCFNFGLNNAESSLIFGWNSYVPWLSVSQYISL